MFLFHVFFKLRHYVLDLVWCQLRFTGNGVFDAGDEEVGINVHLLPAQIKSDIHANAVAYLVFLIFELG